MASSSDTAAALSVATQFLPYNGPFLIAIHMTWLLYGCFLAQIYHYYSFHSTQDRWLKVLVGASGLAATLHIGIASVSQWKMLVEHWGDGSVWANGPWEAGFAPLTSALNGIIVQFFYVARITAFSRHTSARVSAAIILLASILGFGGSIAIAVMFLEAGSNMLKFEIEATATRVWSISSVVCDALIAATMIVILSHAHSRTSVKKMQCALTRLTLHSIETGTVTAVNMLMYLICYEAFKGTTMYTISAFASGPLYGNVLLFVLNSRQRIRAELNERDSFGPSGVSKHPSHGTASPSGIVTTESDILAQYNAYATEMELNDMGDYGQSRSTTGVSVQ